MNVWSTITHSEAETLRIGEVLGSLLQGGEFVGLVGELGSGKTHFAKGVAVGIGVDPSVRITSPTYTLLNTHAGRLPLYHFDLYRLAGDSDVVDLGFSEYFYGGGVSLVEWADRLEDELPEERLTVVLGYEGPEERRIEMTATGERYMFLLRRVAEVAG